MKKLLALLFVTFCATFILGKADVAQATCGLYGKVIYSYQSSSGSTSYYVAPLTTYPTYYYYFTLSGTSVTTSALATKLAIAQANDQTVYIYGNASSCPTSGTVRSAGIISSVYMYSMR